METRKPRDTTLGPNVRLQKAENQIKLASGKTSLLCKLSVQNLILVSNNQQMLGEQ